MSKPELPIDHEWLVKYDQSHGEVYINIVYQTAGWAPTFIMRRTIKVEAPTSESDFDTVVRNTMFEMADEFILKRCVAEWVKKWQV